MNTLNYFLTADYPTGDPLDNKCGPLKTSSAAARTATRPTSSRASAPSCSPRSPASTPT